MPAKAGGKKAAKSDDEPKKKDSTKGSKKNAEDAGEVGSATTGNTSSSKTPAGNLARGTSQLGTPTDESSTKEAGASTIEPGQQTEGNREGGEPGDNAASAPVPEADIKYEEPILPNLIVLNYEGGKEKGLYEGYGTATYVGGHTYTGDWSGNMMHGQGRYEWADGVVYTGSIVNNQIEGLGTYQWPDGSEYHGDVLRGRRHGTGIFRHGQSPLTYEGKWYMGNMHGKGTLQFDRSGASYYTGDFIMNIPSGKGRRQYASGNFYEGMWVSGKRHGYGVFSWNNGSGEYIGQWENGIQQGHGVHIWYLIRDEESHYALRNYYEGNFVNGRRNGFGTFYYSSGTKYIGEWKEDQKHGKGKVILRNGTTIEADFSYDRIMTSLTDDMTSMLLIELPEIASKTPIPSASNTLDPMNIKRSESRNTIGPSFKLEFDPVFDHVTAMEDEKKIITEQVFHVLFRHLPKLNQLYRLYARLGVDIQTNVDNTFLMTRMQFWRFILDCNLHSYGVTLIEYDRMIAECLPTENIHGPDEGILVREFLNAIAIICFHLHRLKKIENETPMDKLPTSLQVATAMEAVIEKNILEHAGIVRGNLFTETQKYLQASQYKDSCYQIYLLFCTKNKNKPYDMTMQKRDFLLMLKHFQLIDRTHLTASRVISILAEDDPNIRPSGLQNTTDVRLDIEMCFLEFYEALIACALIYPSNKFHNAYARPSKTAGSEHSLGSQPSIGSPVVPDQYQDSRVSELPTIVVREVSDFIPESPDDPDKPRSSSSREHDGQASSIEPSVLSLSTYATKIHGFFQGVFLPAAISYKNIRELIRVDLEKTWQGLKPTSEPSWSQKYVTLLE
ncbi:unnamed protein product [Adineta ricciae]|uniref:Uncharacterized protein n=1 Tax=Adineta ricciae TaxID=249248 RepID=A0A814LFE0_ADIRI|nr:unnamed protein product [Adineta ricciae]